MLDNANCVIAGLPRGESSFPPASICGSNCSSSAPTPPSVGALAGVPTGSGRPAAQVLATEKCALPRPRLVCSKSLIVVWAVVMPGGAVFRTGLTAVAVRDEGISSAPSFGAEAEG